MTGDIVSPCLAGSAVRPKKPAFPAASCLESPVAHSYSTTSPSLRELLDHWALSPFRDPAMMSVWCWGLNSTRKLGHAAASLLVRGIKKTLFINSFVPQESVYWTPPNPDLIGIQMLDIYCHKNSGSCPVMGESNRSLAPYFGSFHWILVTEYQTKLPGNWSKETNVFLRTCSCFLWIATFPAAEKTQGIHKAPPKTEVLHLVNNSNSQQNRLEWNCFFGLSPDPYLEWTNTFNVLKKPDNTLKKSESRKK